MTTTVEEILDRAVLEGYLTPAVAVEGPAHSAGVLRFGPLEGVLSPSGWSDPYGSGVVGPPADALAVDLGAGGGIPGLVLATLTMCRWVLVDRGNDGGLSSGGPFASWVSQTAWRSWWPMRPKLVAGRSGARRAW